MQISKVCIKICSLHALNIITLRFCFAFRIVLLLLFSEILAAYGLLITSFPFNFLLDPICSPLKMCRYFLGFDVQRETSESNGAGFRIEGFLNTDLELVLRLLWVI